MRNQKFKYITLFTLIFTFILIFTFQNCTKNEEDGPVIRASTGGDKAVFKLSEKYNGGNDVSEILWQIKSGTCGMSTISTETALNIEIPWNQDYEEGAWGGFHIAALTHLEQEDCFIYRSFHFSDVLSVDHLSCVPQYGSISFSLSDDSSTEKIYFPAGSSVKLEFKAYDDYKGTERSLEDESFQWSIKKVGDDTELADSSHTSHQLTHTFSEMGLYEISTKSTSSSENSSRFFDDRQLFIGLCEKEVEAVEIILSEESFGNLTPEEVLETRPIFNYVRPSDTDSSNKVTLIFDDSRERYSGRSPSIYKYNRSSSSKFIDIDIQNADECFFDDEPILATCIQAAIGCPPEQPDCGLHCPYEIREGLSPLSSCSGNALDMSTLDTDTTECTDDIFVVAASQTGQEYKPQKTFYKHCPADQDYCYFGEEGNRPSDHNCPSS